MNISHVIFISQPDKRVNFFDSTGTENGLGTIRKYLLELVAAAFSKNALDQIYIRRKTGLRSLEGWMLNSIPFYYEFK